MNDDSASRRSILGLGGLASLCCVGPGAAAVSGGTAVGLGAGVVEALLTVLAVLAVGAVVRWRAGCSTCDFVGA